MTEPIDRLRPVEGERRRSARRRGDPDPRSTSKTLPAVFAAPEPEPEPPPPQPARKGGAAAFAAQVMGQGGQKRGLRGGPPVLQQAKAAYLETEWSGAQDRRPPRGTVTKTEV